jgi:tRNA A37 N6-isopentenylltransferase MiaA
MGPQFPILKLELQSAQQSFVMAFTEQSLKTDTMVIEAIQKFATPENLQSILDREVARALEAAIVQEVDSFYRYGKGREAVKAAVIKKLESDPYA